MSAWLCTDEHIFEIAKYFSTKAKGYTNYTMDFHEAAKALHTANVDSLSARYGDNSDDDSLKIIIPDTYKPVVTNIHHMSKLVDCFAYQACEVDNWESTVAYKICQSVQIALLSEHDDYEAAPWGFDRNEYIKKFVN